MPGLLNYYEKFDDAAIRLVLLMSWVFMFSRLFIAAIVLGKRLTSWLLFFMFNCVFVPFPCGILGQVWYLIVSIPDLCRLSCFVKCHFYRLGLSQGHVFKRMLSCPTF